VDLESIRDPCLSSGPLAFDTLDSFQTCYPTHCGPPDYRLYLPGDCLRDGNLVAHFLGTYMGDCGGIPWYLRKTSGHTLQSIPRGCLHVQATLAPISFSSVVWRNCSSY
jgi:hypothetical protein